MVDREMKLLVILVIILLLNSLSNANPINGGLTEEDFKTAEHLPEEYKQQPKGKWNIDNHGDEDEQVSYNVPRYAYRKWPNARVPYVVDSRYTSTEKAIIARAMQNIQAVSCVRFVPRTNEVDYINITPDYENGYNCYSYVGRIGQMQKVVMQKDCVRDSAMTHELCHAIGFGHENQRPDALNYIIVHKENIIPSYYQANYAIYSGNDYSTQNLPYDYWSIMHYPSYAYTIRSDLKSMTAKDGTDLSAERIKLTATDSLKIRTYYGCP